MRIIGDPFGSDDPAIVERVEHLVDILGGCDMSILEDWCDETGVMAVGTELRERVADVAAETGAPLLFRRLTWLAAAFVWLCAHDWTDFAEPLLVEAREARKDALAEGERLVANAALYAYDAADFFHRFRRLAMERIEDMQDIATNGAVLLLYAAGAHAEAVGTDKVLRAHEAQHSLWFLVGERQVKQERRSEFPDDIGALSHHLLGDLYDTRASTVGERISAMRGEIHKATRCDPMGRRRKSPECR